MNKPKISVILPIYNVEEYIDTCMYSLLNQTYINDLEVIMVDDGSTDDSRIIIERYALDYENFYAYHKKNEGAGIARNYGLKLAKGDYVHFLDPDDFLEKDFYKILYDLAKKEDSDLVICNALRFRRYKLWKEKLFKNTFQGIGENLSSTHIKEMPQLVYDATVWNKLFKREFIKEKNIKFPEEKIAYQDIIFSLKAHYFAKKVGITNKTLYYWRLRYNTSTTQKVNNIKNFKDRIKNLYFVYDFLNEFNVEEEIVHEEFIKWLKHDLKIFLNRFNTFDEYYKKEIVEKTNKLLKLMPNNITEQLSSFERILYKIIEDKDIKLLSEFIKIEKDLNKDFNVLRKFDEPFNHKEIEDKKILEELKLEEEDLELDKEKLLLHDEEIKEEFRNKYEKYINLKNDDNQDLIAEINSIEHDEENIFINFRTHMPFVPKSEDDEIIVKLISSDANYSIDYKTRKYDNEKDKDLLKKIGPKYKKELIEDEIYQMTIPLELLQDKRCLKIKIIYKTKNIIKERYIKNFGRRVVRYDDLNVNFDVGVDRTLYIYPNIKDDNIFYIKHINVEEDLIQIKGLCKDKINNFYLRNLVNFEKINCSIEYNSEREVKNKNYKENKEIENKIDDAKDEDSYHEFLINIPLKRLLLHPVKKWELNTEEPINSYNILPFYHYNKYYILKISSARDKIKIELDTYNTNDISDLVNELINTKTQLNKNIKDLKNNNKNLKNENKKLTKKNKKLENENKNLKNTIEEYRQRKDVRLVDGIKKHI